MQNTILHQTEALTQMGVGSIWYSAIEHLQIETITFPFVGHEIIFNFGEFSLDGLVNPLFLMTKGLGNKPLRTSIHGRYETLGLMLQPTALYQRLGMSVIDFWGFENACAHYPSKELEELAERIVNENNPRAQIALIENFFHPKNIKRELPRAVNRFLQITPSEILSKGLVNALAQAERISSKHFINQFKEVVGISPYKYLSIYIFNKTLRAIQQNINRRNLQSDFMDFYYDYPHFARSFHQYSSVSFKHYTKALQEKRVVDSFPNTLIMAG